MQQITDNVLRRSFDVITSDTSTIDQWHEFVHSVHKLYQSNNLGNPVCNLVKFYAVFYLSDFLDWLKSVC